MSKSAIIISSQLKSNWEMLTFHFYLHETRHFFLQRYVETWAPIMKKSNVLNQVSLDLVLSSGWFLRWIFVLKGNIFKL